VFRRLGELGVMGMNMPERWGGSEQDYIYNVVLQEETAQAGVTIGSLRTHLDVILPYFRRYASAEQRERWFGGICAGELMTAIALTEPDTGSDLAAVRTSAIADGDTYILNGAKTYITGGSVADLVIVLCRTATDPANRRNGLTLLVVEDGMPGFAKGRKLPKIGLKAQDTVELSFTDVAVPAANRLGEEGQAFGYLGVNLPQERLAIAVGSVAQARAALDLTVSYVRERRIFGQPVGSFQNTKFELAAMAADLEAGQAVLDRAISECVADELTPADAAKVKLFCTELQGRVVDRCLQLFGGFGYITESPIARLYADARVTRIYGGTSEVMKSIISKSLGL
jgi:acyl-CoA dehydrogenase